VELELEFNISNIVWKFVLEIRFLEILANFNILQLLFENIQFCKIAIIVISIKIATILATFPIQSTTNSQLLITFRNISLTFCYFFNLWDTPSNILTVSLGRPTASFRYPQSTHRVRIAIRLVFYFYLFVIFSRLCKDKGNYNSNNSNNNNSAIKDNFSKISIHNNRFHNLTTLHFNPLDTFSHFICNKLDRYCAFLSSLCEFPCNCYFPANLSIVINISDNYSG